MKMEAHLYTGKTIERWREFTGYESTAIKWEEYRMESPRAEEAVAC